MTHNTHTHASSQGYTRWFTDVLQDRQGTCWEYCEHPNYHETSDHSIMFTSNSMPLRRDQRDLQLEIRSEPSIPKLQMQQVQLIVPRPPQRGSLAELLGGFQHVFNFHPEIWGRWTQFWRSYFSDGLEKTHQPGYNWRWSIQEAS